MIVGNVEKEGGTETKKGDGAIGVEAEIGTEETGGAGHGRGGVDPGLMGHGEGLEVAQGREREKGCLKLMFFCHR